MDRKNIHDWLRGPVVAVATPFKEDFSLDLAALQDNIRFMIEGGVTTGDGRPVGRRRRRRVSKPQSG